MLKKTGRKLPLILIASIGLFIGLGFFIKQKIETLTADPQGEKNCPPRDPSLATADIVSTDETINIESPSMAQYGGTINDASCLDATAIDGVIAVNRIEDIQKALSYAKAAHKKISIAGVRHSMGGQAFSKGALVLDMRGFNAMSLNSDTKILTVQSGATWHDIQNYLHPKFAVKAMQSTDIFTVGGSISVNAHGMDHHAGSVSGSIRSLRLLTPDGKILTLSPSENTQLFKHVIGGYGLFGIILDADIEVVPNDIYETKRRFVSHTEFPEIYEKEIKNNPNYGLFYAHLSMAPSSYLKEMMIYLYEKSDVHDAQIQKLEEVRSVKLQRFVLELGKKGGIYKEARWWMEKVLEPKMESCTITRNAAQASGEACLVSRNDPMHDSVPYLRNADNTQTDILHEYFIPEKAFLPFIDEMREIFLKHNANVGNISVRIVHKNDTALSYAPDFDGFSIVLYINQKTTPADNEGMAILTSDLIDLTQKHGGRFFLPYQLYYTKEQLKLSYPNIDEVFAYKRSVDPDNLLSNTWYEKYKEL